jgi:hypothetical protein
MTEARESEGCGDAAAQQTEAAKAAMMAIFFIY